MNYGYRKTVSFLFIWRQYDKQQAIELKIYPYAPCVQMRFLFHRVHDSSSLLSRPFVIAFVSACNMIHVAMGIVQASNITILLTFISLTCYNKTSYYKQKKSRNGLLGKRTSQMFSFVDSCEYRNTVGIICYKIKHCPSKRYCYTTLLEVYIQFRRACWSDHKNVNKFLFIFLRVTSRRRNTSGSH